MKTAKNNRIVKITFIGIVLLLSIINYISIDYEIHEDQNINKIQKENSISKLAGYWVLDPIFINDDIPAQNWSKTALENDWCSGTGSYENPYLIENITINGNNGSYCIFIQNSTKQYWTIRNCTFYNTSRDDLNSNILIVESTNGTIIDNEIYGAESRCITLVSNSKNNTIINNRIFNIGATGNEDSIVGILLNEVYNNSLINNEIYNSSKFGVLAFNSIDNLIDNNTIYKNGEYGIAGSDLLRFNITNNVCYNNTNGNIILVSTNFSNIENNEVYNTSDNIDCFDSKNLTIKENLISFSEKGIKLENSSGFIVNNNKLWNNSIIDIFVVGIYSQNNTFYENRFLSHTNNSAMDNGTLNKWYYENIGNYWWNYTGVDADDDGIGDIPYLISGEAGTYDNFPIWNDGFNGDPILINDAAANDWDSFSSKFWLSGSGTIEDPYIIQDLIINGSYTTIPIHITNSVNKPFIIENCTVFSSPTGLLNAGIRITSSNNGTIRNCVIYDCSSNAGVLLFTAEHCIVEDNIVLYSTYGVAVYINSRNNTIRNNKIGYISIYAIVCGNSVDTIIIENNEILGSQNGIYIFLNCIDISILKNNISQTTESAIIILLTSNTQITENYIYNNTGIDAVGIFLNSDSFDNLIFNNIFENNFIHAIDNGTNNNFNNSIIGNYWDDYTGVDADDNGIGDTPYLINGEAGTYDYLPIWNDGDEEQENDEKNGNDDDDDDDNDDDDITDNLELAKELFYIRTAAFIIGVLAILMYARKEALFGQ